MNTRIAKTSDPGAAPERNLSAAHLRPVNVSLAIASLAAREYDPETRANCLWLANVAANSQRIQLCWQKRGLPDPLGTLGRITEAALGRRLGLQPSEIYRCLTGDPDADLSAFNRAVGAYRAHFAASLPPLVKTQDSATIGAAFAMASDKHKIVVASGKWRHGKTEEFERQWLTNLQRCVWLHCPSNNDERTFIFALASALGISTGGGKKASQLREQIKRAVGIGLIDTIIIDEAHGLWPTEIATAKPLRAEYVRELCDSLGIGFVLITTDQFALALELAKEHNTRWAPGQFGGRRAYFKLRETHTDAEIRSIAKLHAGPIEEAALDGLLAFARADEGYLGAMVTAAQMARVYAGQEAPIGAAHVARATKEQQTESRIIEMAKKSRRGSKNTVYLANERRAAA